MAQEPGRVPLLPGNRVRVFVDYWNLVLSMRTRDQAFSFDWDRLPRWLAVEGGRVCGQESASYEGAHVYASFNPRSSSGHKTRRWMRDWLDMRIGVQVNLREQRHKDPPSCPSCYHLVATCPSCGESMARYQEKGVDTAIVTDMIRLAWEDAYDIAVLVSSDSDFVPVVEFLDLRGKKVVQAGFPPAANQLAKACWASFDLYGRRAEFERSA